MSATGVATTLRCEYFTNPLGIDSTHPRLSWLIADERRGARQTAYQILIASSPAALARDEGDVWDSGPVASAQTIHVVYQGPALASGQHYWWKVRIWDGDGNASAYSDAAWWEMGLLHREDWRAQWIHLPQASATEPLIPAPYLRKTFTIDRPLQHARLYITARGLYEAAINGSRVGDQLLAPGWTDYRKRIQYQTYDVTALLTHGENAAGAILSTGWYSGHVGWPHDGRNYHHYGSQPALLFQLQLLYADGSQDIIGSDDTWHGTTGPILSSDMQAGESYDARKELTGWHTTTYDDGQWQRVTTSPLDANVQLVADRAQPIQRTEELHPQHIEQRADGSFVVDIGQNMVGWVRLRVQGAAGTQVRLRFAEMLNSDGSLHTTNLRSAQQTDTYYLQGSAQPEVFEPRFTFHGFRYIEISGYPGNLTADDLTGIVVHSATPFTSRFTSSHPMVNKLVQNILWGQRGNFISVPTDCPQRDERLGWMGDAQIFVRTACYNAEVAPFFSKWMVDVVDAQAADGGFADVSPRVVDMANGAPAWGDAGVIVPWTIYRMYGDTRILEEHYAAMQRWINYVHEANPNLLWEQRRFNDYGDWLSIEADTPKDVLATAYFAYDARLMEQIAQTIGRYDDAQRYQRLFQDIKAAFNRAYVSADGKIKGETQTCYLLALYMELLPDDLRPLAAKHLVADIEQRGGRLSTGFVGVSYLCPVLSAMGYDDVAYRLLTSEAFPSWGYSIKHGATTIWERWNGWTEEDGFNNDTMNSFNHYSFGSIGQWLYQYAAGITPDFTQLDRPRCEIRPHIGKELTTVHAIYPSICGPIESQWQQSDEGLTLHVSIPANMQATIAIPATDKTRVLEGEVYAGDAPGVDWQGEEQLHEGKEHRQIFRVGAGRYTFRVK